MVDIIRITILKAAISWKIQLNWYEQTKTTHLNIMSWLQQYLQKKIHSWVPPISRSKVLRVFSSKLWYLCSLSQIRASINRSKGWKWYISDGDANKSAIDWFFFRFASVSIEQEVKFLQYFGKIKISLYLEYANKKILLWAFLCFKKSLLLI